MWKSCAACMKLTLPVVIFGHTVGNSSENEGKAEVIGSVEATERFENRAAEGRRGLKDKRGGRSKFGPFRLLAGALTE